MLWDWYTLERESKRRRDEVVLRTNSAWMLTTGRPENGYRVPPRRRVGRWIGTLLLRLGRPVEASGAALLTRSAQEAYP
jgi:hypothetical protein